MEQHGVSHCESHGGSAPLRLSEGSADSFGGKNADADADHAEQPAQKQYRNGLWDPMIQQTSKDTQEITFSTLTLS